MKHVLIIRMDRYRLELSVEPENDCVEVNLFYGDKDRPTDIADIPRSDILEFNEWVKEVPTK